MRSATGLLILLAWAPYVVWADSAAAAAAAASSDDSDAAAAAAAAAASSNDGDAAAAAAAAAATGDGAAAAAAAAAASSKGPTRNLYCNCNRDYVPVCGTDGKTYSNECILRCVSYENVRCNGYPIGVYKHGVCPSITCRCPKIRNPVCGKNNQTYDNECYLDCENSVRVYNGLQPIGIAYRTACRAPTCICPHCVIPVCGTDGKTYKNVCTLECYSRANQAQHQKAIYVKHEGACISESCICPYQKNELCASDDKTYYNDCAFKCQNRRREQLELPLLIIKYRGKCINCVCPAVAAPVCANNDVTFPNHCSYLCENKKRKNANLPALYLRWEGQCDCGCSKRWQPVCASNYNTIQNRCMLRCQNKKRVQDGLRELSVLREGPCYLCDCGHCGVERQPVCGSDGRTYWNICWLRCNAECRARANQPPLWKRCSGEC